MQGAAFFLTALCSIRLKLHFDTGTPVIEGGTKIPIYLRGKPDVTFPMQGGKHRAAKGYFFFDFLFFPFLFRVFFLIFSLHVRFQLTLATVVLLS
jgi:hypothetical protein